MRRVIIAVLCMVSVVFAGRHWQNRWEVQNVPAGWNCHNIFVSEYKINGLDLDIGDEIAVFDYDRMVGCKYIEELIPEDSVFNFIAKPHIDPEFPCSGQGFYEGHTMSYRLWDHSEQIEIVNPTVYNWIEQGAYFAISGTSHIYIRGYSLYPANIAMTEKEKYILDCYPNPFNSKTEISFKMETAEKVKIEILNVQGQIVHQVEKQAVIGLNRVSFRAESLKSGTYFVVLRFRDSKVINKIVLLR